MSNVIYPGNIRGLGFTTVKSSRFSTITQKSPAFVETRLAQSQNPEWTWTLIYNYLKDDPRDINPGLNYTDLKTLQGFILARQGSFDSFLYDDPYDDSVGPGLLPGGSPNPQSSLQLVEDVSTSLWYSPIQIFRGGQFYEDITDLGPAGITVYANGVLQLQGTNFNVGGPGLSITGFSYQGLYLAWTSAPVGPITAQFNFYHRVRFASDDQDIEQFMQFLWTIGGPDSQQGSGQLKLQTVKTANT